VPATFWKQAIDSLRNITTHKLLLFAEGGRSDLFASGFQLRYGMGFYYQLANSVYGKNAAATTLDSAQAADYVNAAAINRVVHYTSNHDVNNADGTPLEIFNGARGAMAAFVATAYMPSVPMLYNGQEVGCAVRLSYFNTTTTIDFTVNADITAEYKKVLAFRNSSDALRKGTLTAYSSKDVSAFVRTYNGKQVWVLVNLRNEKITYTTPAALSGGSWKDAFSGATVTFGSTVVLEPYTYTVVQNQ
jgi:glycosidase